MLTHCIRSGIVASEAMLNSNIVAVVLLRN
jgi:hypothetical protein